MAFPNSDFQRNWQLLPLFFSPEESQTLDHRLRGMQARRVVYCSFENRLAKSGGLGAVGATLLPFLRQQPGIDRVVLLTPFHARIADRTKVVPTGQSITVPFAGNLLQVEILTSAPTICLKSGVEEYYLAHNRFFQAENPIADPYLHDPENTERNRFLLRQDALFFCAAVPLATARLGLESETVFHLQEWQTTLLSLTSKEAMLAGHLQSVGCIQTLHNPYDEYIPPQELADILTDRRRQFCREGLANRGFTALQIGLQMIDGPVTTVSETFARELRGDILQSGYFAPHLQDIFRDHHPIGIANGRFIDFSKELPASAASDHNRLASFKGEYRSRLLDILADYRPSARFGALTWRNRSIRNLPPHIPIFVMSGRLDWNQKGFDILLRVLDRFARDEIKVVLAPLPLKTLDLEVFRATAAAKRGDLTVFPIRMERGYLELLRGASFGLMPSIYEPFGAAVEYMVSGTPTLARRCGGLADQVIDGETGFLFREEAGSYQLEDIRHFLSQTDFNGRNENPWAEAMVSSLSECIRRSIDLFQNHPRQYLEMIGNGIDQATRFDWQESARRYSQVYQAVGKGDS